MLLVADLSLEWLSAAHSIHFGHLLGQKSTDSSAVGRKHAEVLQVEASEEQEVVSEEQEEVSEQKWLIAQVDFQYLRAPIQEPHCSMEGLCDESAG